jgi:hypothetical protein
MKTKTTNRPQRESAAARAVKHELRQFLDPITLAKINVATKAVAPGSDAYWEIAEPMIRDWLTSRMPSECIKMTPEWVDWVRWQRQAMGPGAVVIDAKRFNLNKGKATPGSMPGQNTFGYLPLHLKEEDFSEDSLAIAADFFSGDTLDMVLSHGEDEVVIAFYVVLRNEYMCFNVELVSLA